MKKRIGLLTAFMLFGSIAGTGSAVFADEVQQETTAAETVAAETNAAEGEDAQADASALDVVTDFAAIEGLTIPNGCEEIPSYNYKGNVINAARTDTGYYLLAVQDGENVSWYMDKNGDGSELVPYFEFVSLTSSYIPLPVDADQVPEGLEPVEADFGGTIVDAWRNPLVGDSSLVYFYAMDENGNEGWYRVDGEIGGVVRYVADEKETEPVTQDKELLGQIEDYKNAASVADYNASVAGSELEKTRTANDETTLKGIIIIVALGVAILILLLIIAILAVKLKDRKDDDDDDDSDVTKKRSFQEYEDADEELGPSKKKSVRADNGVRVRARDAAVAADFSNSENPTGISEVRRVKKTESSAVEARPAKKSAQAQREVSSERKNQAEKKTVSGDRPVRKAVQQNRQDETVRPRRRPEGTDRPARRRPVTDAPSSTAAETALGDIFAEESSAQETVKQVSADTKAALSSAKDTVEQAVKPVKQAIQEVSPTEKSEKKQTVFDDLFDDGDDGEDGFDVIDFKDV